MSSPTNQKFWQLFFPAHKLLLYATAFLISFTITGLFVILSQKCDKQAELLQRLDKIQNRIELLEKAVQKSVKTD